MNKNFRKYTIGTLKPLEYFLESIYKDHQAQTVWIVGPPRSGTTLLYNLLVQNYPFTYISNFTARFAEIPLLSSLYESAFLKKKENKDFDFHYGQTKGLLGPHEAEKLWYRWFPGGTNIYVANDFWEEKKLTDFKRVINSLCGFKKKPGLFKNTYNSMRIAPIVQAFPEAVFLVCDRDPTDVAQSILNARIKKNKDKSKWWALPPKEFEEIKNHDYWEQVVEQAYYIYKQIEADKNARNSDNFLSVSYKNLCLNPDQELKKIETFLIKRKIDVCKMNKEKIDKKNITYSTGQKVNDEDYKRIQKKVKQLLSNE